MFVAVPAAIMEGTLLSDLSFRERDSELKINSFQVQAALDGKPKVVRFLVRRLRTDFDPRAILNNPYV